MVSGKETIKSSVIDENASVHEWKLKKRRPVNCSFINIYSVYGWQCMMRGANGEK